MKRARLILPVAIAAAFVAAAVPGAGIAEKPPPPPKKVTVNDDYYSPVALTVHKGARIKWVWANTNYDTHNVRLQQGPTGVKADDFRSPTGAIGLRFTRQLTKPGVYKFVCSLHSTVMKMTVTVQNH